MYYSKRIMVEEIDCNLKENASKCKKDYTKLLNEQYSFSKNDNQIKKVKITPHKFLKITWREHVTNCKRENEWRESEGKEPRKCITDLEEYKKEVIRKENVEGIKEVLTGKKESKYGIPVPFLEFDKCGRPIGHEGRHTVTALEELGHKEIPVTIVRRKGSYNWEKPCN